MSLILTYKLYIYIYIHAYILSLHSYTYTSIKYLLSLEKKSKILQKENGQKTRKISQIKQRWTSIYGKMFNLLISEMQVKTTLT